MHENLYRLAEQMRRATGSPEPRRPAEALWIDADAWDEAALPLRPWLAKGYMMRGTVCLLAGGGSAGKSSLTLAWAVSLATGMPFGLFAPDGPTTVVVYNVEDNADEQRRRLSAALRAFGRTPQAIAGKVIRCGPRTIGILMERDPQTGQLVPTEAWATLEALMAETRAGVLVLDPLVELHDSQENDNTALRLVIAYLRELAVRHNCAVVLVHHARKGGEAADVDSIRGAGSIVGAVRTALTVTPMSAEEGESFGIPARARGDYFRLDNVKSNYSRGRGTDWHQLQPFELANGEEVVAAMPWTPPSQAAREIPPEVMERLCSAVAAGSPQGPYSARLTADQPRSVAIAMRACGILGLAEQKRALQAMFDAGWEVAEYRNAHRNVRTGLRSPSGQPAAQWSLPS